MKTEYLNNSVSLGGIEVIPMEFKKVTISLPKSLYDEGMLLVKRGMFSNFSDLVRSGIRSEFKENLPISKEMYEEYLDEKYIYNNKALVARLLKPVDLKNCTVCKTDEELDEFLEDL